MRVFSIKFHGNPSSENHADTCSIGTDKQPDTISHEENAVMVILCSPQCKMYVGLHIECLMFLPNWIKFGHAWQISIEVPSIKFHGNMSSGSHSDTDRHDEVHRCFRSYAKKSNNILEQIHQFVHNSGVFWTQFFHLAELLHSDANLPHLNVRHRLGLPYIGN